MHITQAKVSFLWVPGRHSRRVFQVICLCGRRKAGGARSHACSCLPRFVVHGLTAGEQYIFRVKAVNAVGTSENSQESDVIKVQAALSESFCCSAPVLLPARLHFCTKKHLRCQLECYRRKTRGCKLSNREHRVLWELLITWPLVSEMPVWWGDMVTCSWDANYTGKILSEVTFVSKLMYLHYNARRGVWISLFKIDAKIKQHLWPFLLFLV